MVGPCRQAHNWDQATVFERGDAFYAVSRLERSERVRLPLTLHLRRLGDGEVIRRLVRLDEYLAG